MLQLLVVPASFYLVNHANTLATTAFQTCSTLSETSHDAISSTVAYITISFILGCFVDSSILYQMYINDIHKGVSKKRLGFIGVNWLISFLFLVNLPLSLSFLQSAYTAKTSLILAFSSVSYLMGYFGFAQFMKGEKVAWKLAIPPLHYLITTIFAYRAHSTVALTFATVFFGVYALSFALFNQKNSSVTSPVVTNPDECTETTTCSPPEQANKYSRIDVPANSNIRHASRQLVYDLVVYAAPLLIVGLLFKSLQTFVSIACFVATFWRPVYEFAARMIFLKSSPPEDPGRAARRLPSYNKGSEFPTGWFRVAHSDEIGVQEVKYIKALGRDLAVFRGEDGKVRVLDAYCIHLGANMAIGGKVVGNCLECPFHKWTFAGDGACNHIPYQPKVPSSAKTKAYPVLEYFGHILVWFKCGGNSIDEKPDYMPPIPKGMDSGSMVHRGNLSLTVNMHLQEFAENSTDFAHFAPLHGTMTFPFTPVEFPVITINHRPGWKCGESDESHMCWFLDSADINFLGKQIPGTGADAVITFVGPAGLVYFSFETPIGRIHLFQTHTPREALQLETNFRWYADATMPRLLVWYIVGNWIAQWQNDIMVWENKRYAGNPVLVKGDGPMNKQRRWFKQFYTNTDDSSTAKKLEDEDCSNISCQKSLDW